MLISHASSIASYAYVNSQYLSKVFNLLVIKIYFITNKLNTNIDNTVFYFETIFQLSNSDLIM